MKKVILFLAALSLGVLVFGPGLLFFGCSGEERDDDDGSIHGTEEPSPVHSETCDGTLSEGEYLLERDVYSQLEGGDYYVVQSGVLSIAPDYAIRYLEYYDAPPGEGVAPDCAVTYAVTLTEEECDIEGHTLCWSQVSEEVSRSEECSVTEGEIDRWSAIVRDDAWSYSPPCEGFPEEQGDDSLGTLWVTYPIDSASLIYVTDPLFYLHPSESPDGVAQDDLLDDGLAGMVAGHEHASPPGLIPSTRR